ncbi:hypothetical protein LPW11_05620 [Geomonas sp. RF6]|uniref:hypothetical protein n=1 Tax=Geomonas sp. RF6 TaxID=2897342 RepID=UPI001E2BD59A|nr:hypothetical protein [Geomonas sp. RF6]UFS71671.1 hypothetical protein LPW11_05620 [Geomonas sp. RF6]
MDKEAILKKTAEVLTPFETGNLVEFVRHLTVQKAISNPWFVAVFFVLAFYAIVKRSKFVLGALFTAASLLILIHYTIPAEGGQLSLSTTLPFAFGALAIGGVLIYWNFIKTE